MKKKNKKALGGKVSDPVSQRLSLKNRGLDNLSIEDPNTALAENNIRIARAMFEAESNPWTQGLDFLGNSAIQVGSALMGKGLSNGETWGQAGEILKGLFQKRALGGKVGTVSVEDLMEEVLNPLEFSFGGSVPVEVEGNEVGQLPGGDLIDFEGPSHEAGGINTLLPGGTEIFSDRIKIDGVSMADRKKKREKQSEKLNKALEQNPTDVLLKNSVERNNQISQSEEDFDFSVQELTEIFMPSENYANGGRVGNREIERHKRNLERRKADDITRANQKRREEESLRRREEYKKSKVDKKRQFYSNKSQGAKKQFEEERAKRRLIDNEKNYLTYLFNNNLEDNTSNRNKFYNNPTDLSNFLFQDESSKYISKQKSPVKKVANNSGNVENVVDNVVPSASSAKPIEERITVSTPKKPRKTTSKTKGDTPASTSNKDVEFKKLVQSQIGDKFSLGAARRKKAATGTSGEGLAPYWQDMVDQGLDISAFMLENDKFKGLPDIFGSKNVAAITESLPTTSGMTEEEYQKMVSTPATKNTPTSFLDSINQAGLPTFGDAMGIFGNLRQAYGPRNLTLENRAGDTPNVNPFLNFGQDGLDTLEETKDLATQMRDQTLRDLDLARTTSMKRNRGSARGINTQRALDVATDTALNEATGGVYSNYMTQLMQILSQEAQMENIRDQVVMQGEAQRDLADRQDRDNFYTQLSRDEQAVGEALTRTGGAINRIKERGVNSEFLNQLYDYVQGNITTGNISQKDGIDLGGGGRSFDIQISDFEKAKGYEEMGLTKKEWDKLPKKTKQQLYLSSR